MKLSCLYEKKNRIQKATLGYYPFYSFENEWAVVSIGLFILLYATTCPFLLEIFSLENIITWIVWNFEVLWKSKFFCVLADSTQFKWRSQWHVCAAADTPLQHTSLISTLQTRTDLAGEMSFKKRCHFNQGFCVCLLSRRTHCSSCSDCCCDRGSRAIESGGSSVLWGVNWQNYLKMLNWTLSVLQLLSQ